MYSVAIRDQFNIFSSQCSVGEVRGPSQTHSLQVSLRLHLATYAVREGAIGRVDRVWDGAMCGWRTGAVCGWWSGMAIIIYKLS